MDNKQQNQTPPPESQTSNPSNLPSAWVYHEGWITVSYPFLRLLLQIHKHSLQKRQVKRWDYLVDAEWNYTKLWNRRALLWNERTDLKIFANAMVSKQKDAMKNCWYSKEEMLERLRDSAAAQKRVGAQLEEVNKTIEEADKAINESAIGLSWMTKCFIERDLPILAEMTDELIKEQAKEGRKEKKVSSTFGGGGGACMFCNDGN